MLFWSIETKICTFGYHWSRYSVFNDSIVICMQMLIGFFIVLFYFLSFVRHKYVFLCEVVGSAYHFARWSSGPRDKDGPKSWPTADSRSCLLFICARQLAPESKSTIYLWTSWYIVIIKCAFAGFLNLLPKRER